MLDKPQIVQTADQPAAVIRLKIPREEIQKVMGAGIQELIATVQKQGVGPTGPVFSHHFRMDPGTFDFEIGVPVKAPVQETERVKNGKLAGRPKVARTVYRGPYEGLGPAWGEFNQILKAQGLEIAGDLWEVYVAGPESGPDPSQWQTELNRPLAG